MSDQKRKLAVIVFTDIVGFTKLTSQDQQKASDLLDTQRKEFSFLVKSFQGKWVKEMGDGLILTFDTISKAVRCCVKMQQRAKTIEHLNLRIGMHLGEILEKENDIIGDDVNIAARIEPFSAPGGIAISNKINDALIREPEFNTKYLGKPKLKGVAQSVEIYCITSHDLNITDLSKISAKIEKNYKLSYIALCISLFIVSIICFSFFNKDKIESVAILYLDARGDKELEYVEEITEDLIFELSSATNGLLRVPEIASVKKYKSKDLEYSELGKALDVNYIFQSSVKPEGLGFNLRCRLVEAKSGKDIFINKWFIDRNYIQSIVGVLAENIIKELNIKENLYQGNTRYNAEAYELYLKSKRLYSTSNSYEDSQKSIDMMIESVRLDDNFISAKLFLGQMYFNEGQYERADRLYEKALIKSKSLSDNVNIAETLRKQGQLLRERKDFKNAVKKFKEALLMCQVLNDRNAMAKILNSFGILYFKNNQKEDALQNWLEALRIAEQFEDKIKIAKYLNNLGIWYSDDGNYSRAIDYFQKSIKIKNEFGDRTVGKTFNNIGDLYFRIGDYQNAINYFDKSISLKNKLNDIKGSNSSIMNKVKVHFYNSNYDSALVEINNSRILTKSNKKEIFYGNRNRYAGMLFYHKGYFDSSLFYLNTLKFSQNNYSKQNLIDLIYLALVNQKLGDYELSNKHAEDFLKIIKYEDPPKKFAPLIYWMSYNFFNNYKNIDQAHKSLENAYLEIKSFSKEITNIKDRKMYLNIPLHKDIISEREKKIFKVN